MSGVRAAPSSSDEREVLLGYVQRQRKLVVATADGLTDDELRWTPDGKLLPIIGIINHLTAMEWRWIEGRYLGTPFPPRAAEFVVGPERSCTEVIAAYSDRAARTESVVRAAPDLAVACLGCEGDGPPAHMLLDLGAPVDLRWVLLHLVEETAHHAGHADAKREMLDGRRMTG